MSATCDPVAHRISTYLGFDCEHANAFLTLRNPFDLANWTLPILEFTIIAGAVLALIHAIRRLRRDGYCVWSINLGGLFDAFNTHGIDESAERVRDKVERLYGRYNLGPLSIIGHSKGGLIGRYYVKRLGGDRRVKNLITLGTPHNGTPTAYLGCVTMGAFARSVWQMTPMSPFMRLRSVMVLSSSALVAVTSLRTSVTLPLTSVMELPSLASVAETFSRTWLNSLATCSCWRRC